MSVNPQWSVKFDDTHRLGTFWQPLYNAGIYNAPKWVSSNNGITNALYLYINLPDNTDIISTQVNGSWVSDDNSYYIISYYDDYNIKGNILSGKLLSSGGKDSRDGLYSAEVKGAKSLFISIPLAHDGSYVDGIIITGYGTIDPFETPFTPPTTTPTPTDDNTGIFQNIYDIIAGANKAVLDNIGATSPDWKSLLSAIENAIGTDPASLLALFGVNVGQYSQLLNKAFQAVLDGFVYQYQTGANIAVDFDSAVQLFLANFQREVSIAFAANNDAIAAKLQDLATTPPTVTPEQFSSNVNTLIDSLPDFLKPIGVFILNLVNDFKIWGVDKSTPTSEYLITRIGQLADIVQNLDDNNYSSLQPLIKDLFGIDTNQKTVTNVINFFALVPVLLDLFKLIHAPTEQLVQQLALADINPTLLSPGDVISSYFRGNIDYGRAIAELKKHGISEERSVLLFGNNITELSPNEALAANDRNFIPESEVDRLLTHQGYDDSTIKTLKQLNTYQYSLADVIELGQRRLLEPSVTFPFNQNTDFPSYAKQHLDELNLSDSQQQALWAAHWQLPGFSEVLEMYHRGLINDNDFAEYQKLSPILPFFRDKLIGLSHKVLSRLDIRKLVKTGQLDYAGVVAAFMAQGYAESDAQKLAVYTMKFDEQTDVDDITALNKRLITSIETQYLHNKINSIDAYNALISYGVDSIHATKILQVIDVERNISENKSKTAEYINRAIALIQHSYSTGGLPYKDANAELIRLGLTASEASLELNVLDIERDVNQKKEIANVVVDNFAHGRITNQEFNTILAEYGFNAAEISYLRVDAGIKAQHKTLHPTLAQLEKWRKKNIITHNELIEELVNLGYSDKYIFWILDEIGEPQS